MHYKLSDLEFKMVSRVIASNTGLHFPVEKRNTLSRNLALASKELGFHKMKEFIQWLLASKMNKDEIGILASHITISETYFWREPKVFDALTQHVLNEVAYSKKTDDRSIRIWCAACSTGEEVYSLAIALCIAIPRIEDWDITIIASDLSTASLIKARAGIYSFWSFRNSPFWFTQKYFKKRSSLEFEILPEIRKMVTFSSFNLTDGNYLSNACNNHRMDIIFCRNVLMYLTKEWAAKVTQYLFDALSENGWLAVSSCELSSELFPQFSVINFPGAVLYRKIETEIPVNDYSMITFDNQLLLNNVQSITSSASIVNQFSGENSKETGIKENKISIRSLADQGYLEEALLACNQAIESDKLAPSLYFLRASILQELNKCSEAIKSLKQAIYVDPYYVMGYFTLGNIFARQGTFKKASQYFNNALDILSKISNDEIPEESGGMSARYIREIILNSLETHKAT
jgi:chemotaxis protein methyltransferase CheR